MRRFVFFFVVLLSVNSLSGCRSKDDPTNPILGLWIIDKYEYTNGSSYVNYQRAKKFEKNKPGYRFRANGILGSYQIAAFCATPPVAYEETEGEWSMQNDTLNLMLKFWGGTDHKKYVITKLTSNTLQIKQAD